MRLQELYDLVVTEIREGQLVIDGDIAQGAFASLTERTGGEISVFNCKAVLNANTLSVSGRGRVPFLPFPGDWEIGLACSERGVENPTSLRFYLREEYAFSEVFGTQAVTVRNVDTLLKECPSVLDPLRVSELCLEQADKPEQASMTAYQVSGRLSIPAENGDWQEYRELLDQVGQLKGSLSFARKQGGSSDQDREQWLLEDQDQNPKQWRLQGLDHSQSPDFCLSFQLDAPINQSFFFLHQRTKQRRADGSRQLSVNPALKDNTLYLRLQSAVFNPYTGQKTASGARIICRIKLGGAGIELGMSLFQEGAVWRLTGPLDPPLGLTDMVRVLSELTGLPNVASALTLPDGLPGLSAVKLREVELSLNSYGDTWNPSWELGEISVTLSACDLWTPLIPFLKVDEVGGVFTLNFGEQNEGIKEGYLLTGGCFGYFRVPLSGGKSLLLNVWVDLHTLDVVGELLVRIEEKEREETAVPALLSNFGLASSGLDQLTLGSLKFEASVPGRSLSLYFDVSFGQSLAFHVFGLRVRIDHISGEIELSQEQQNFFLEGSVEFGTKNSFTLGASFSYEDSSWQFRCWLCSGEVSIANLARELLMLPDFTEEPLLDLKLTELDVNFSGDDSRPFSIHARLEQPWSAKLLGVPLLLYGQVDLEKTAANDHGQQGQNGSRLMLPGGWELPGMQGNLLENAITGTLEAGFFLGKFRMRAIYRMLKEKSYLFEIAYGGLYLQALVEQEKGHDILTLCMGGATLGGLIEELIHMINPNQSFQLSKPWDVLGRISLEKFELKFDLTDRSVAFLYRADLDLLGLVHIDQIGARYEKGAVKLLLTGRFLEKEYTLGDPVSWDAVNESPPDIGGSSSRVIQISYLGMGQHFGSEELLTAKSIAEAIEALKKQLQPVGADGLPPVSYSEEVQWLFGADMTYKGMLRVRMVLNDPSLYGILITVAKNDSSALSQLSGLSLELLYRRVTKEIGMFRAELVIPDRFRHFQFGAFALTLGMVSLELYTNGNFLIDLGFPHHSDFSRSFAIEAGYYTGRGGLYFGVLCGETTDRVPKIVNGTFSPVITIGIGISLGIGRSFDFSIVKGGFSLEAMAIFEGTFAVFNPYEEGRGKDFYFKVKALLGLKGRLYLTVDFKIITISASAEITASASVALESYQPMWFAVDFDLKVQASIKILFIKIRFSFHFSFHAEFTLGSASVPPWQTLGGGRDAWLKGGASRLRHGGMEQMPMLQLRRQVELSDGLPQQEAEPVSLHLQMIPLFSMENPVMSGQPLSNTAPCAAFLLLLGSGENGLNGVLRLARAWIGAQLGNRVTRAGIRGLSSAMEMQSPDFYEFVRRSGTLTISGVPEGALDGIDQSGWFFPIPPSLKLEFHTLNRSGGEAGAPEIHDLSSSPMVSEAYLRKLHDCFGELDPDPEADSRGVSDVQTGFAGAAEEPLARVLFNDYFSMVVKGLLAKADDELYGRLEYFDYERFCRIAEAVEVSAREAGEETGMSGQNGPKERDLLGIFREEDLFEEGGLLRVLAEENPDWRIAADELEFPSLTLRVREGDTLAGIRARFTSDRQDAEKRPEGNDPAEQEAPGRLDEPIDREILHQKRLLRQGAKVTVASYCLNHEVSILFSPAELAALFYVRFYPDRVGTECLSELLRLNQEVRDWSETFRFIRIDRGSWSESWTGEQTHRRGECQSQDQWPVLYGDGAELLAKYQQVLKRPEQYEGVTELCRWFEEQVGDSVWTPAAEVRIQGEDTLEELLERLSPDRSAEDSLRSQRDHSVLSSDFLEPGVTIQLGQCTVRDCAGRTIREFLSQYPMDYGALSESLRGRPEALEERDLLIRPQYLDRTGLARLAGSGGGEEAVSAASRFFLQGLRIPTPAQDGELSIAEENWKGLYQVLGQQYRLERVETETVHMEENSLSEAEGDFVRHRLEVSIAPGEEDWISFAQSQVLQGEVVRLKAAAGAEAEPLRIAVTNDEIRDKTPAAAFSHELLCLPSELPQYVRERRTYPIGQKLPLYGGEALQGMCGEQGRTLLLPSEEFLEGRLPQNYEWLYMQEGACSGRSGGGQSPSPLRGERRDGAGSGRWALLVSFAVRQRAEGGAIFEVTGADAADRLKLAKIKDCGLEAVALFSRPSPAQGKEDALYELPLNREQTVLVKSNLSLETHSGYRESAAAETNLYLAPLSNGAEFLELLWQCSVVGGGFVLCTSLREELSKSLFSENGEGSFWLMAVPKEACEGCSCILTEDFLEEGVQPVLRIREERISLHSEEWAEKSTVEPGCAGFSLKLTQPEEVQTEKRILREEEKERLGRNLFSVVSYRVEGAGYRKSVAAVPMLGRETEDVKPCWSFEQIVPLTRLSASDDSRNPYWNIGLPADVFLEYRDVLGNMAQNVPDSWGHLTLTPEFNDPLISPAQWPLLRTTFGVREDKFCADCWGEPESCFARGETQEKTRERILQKRALLQTAFWQMECAHIQGSFSSVLIGEDAIIDKERILEMQRAALQELEWAASLQGPICGAACLNALMQQYELTAQELGDANGQTVLGELYGDGPLVCPQFIPYGEGDSLETLHAPVRCGENGRLPLREGAEVIIAELGQERSLCAEMPEPDFAKCAKLIGCSLAVLVETNQESQQILRAGAIFRYDGYEVLVGENERRETPSLRKVCQVFQTEYGVEVKPLDLVLEEPACVLRDGAMLRYRTMTAKDGESLEENCFGSTAEALWKLNRNTVNLLVCGVSVFLKVEERQTTEEQTLNELCQEMGISRADFVTYNRTAIFQKREEAKIPGRTVLPVGSGPGGTGTSGQAGLFSKPLPENGGRGYSIREIAAAELQPEQVAGALWGLIGILRVGEILVFEGGELIVSEWDCLESILRRAEPLQKDARENLFGRKLLRDGISVPFPIRSALVSLPFAQEYIKKAPTGMLPVEGKLILRRMPCPPEHSGEEIWQAASPLLPEMQRRADGTFTAERFICQLEQALPYVRVAEREKENAGSLCIIILGEGALKEAAFGAARDRYRKERKSPYFLALAPIAPRLISRTCLVAPLESDGTLGTEAAVSFSAIDAEIWAAGFLRDVEQILSPEFSGRMCGAGCEGELGGILSCKEDLAEAIPSRLTEIFQPIGTGAGPDLSAARGVLADCLKKSLTGIGNAHVLLQYPGEVVLERGNELNLRLAGAVEYRGSDAPAVVWKAEKIPLRQGSGALHLLACADRMVNASFPMTNLHYCVREAEYDIGLFHGTDESTEAEKIRTNSAYEPSKWLRLVHPVTDAAGGISLNLQSDLQVPVPLRFYPSMPVLGLQEMIPFEAGSKPGMEELLHWDYSFTYDHAMAGQDTAWIEVHFNDRSSRAAAGGRDVFDSLAQYSSVRNQLWEILNGGESEAFCKGVKTFCSLARNAADSWSLLTDMGRSSASAAKSCRFSMKFALGQERLTLTLNMEGWTPPSIALRGDDGTERSFVRQGMRYVLEGVAEEQVRRGLSLRFTLEHLPLTEIQRVNTKISIHRNEELGEDGCPVNPAFIYRTEWIMFPGQLKAYRKYDQPLSYLLPEEYSKEEALFVRAVRYVFEELLHLEREQLLFACQISYGYTPEGGDASGGQILLPVCFTPRRRYDQSLSELLGNAVKAWTDEGVRTEGRSLWFDLTLFSDAGGEEALPLLSLGRLQINL